MEQCDECGFDYQPATAERAGDAVCEVADAMAAVLAASAPTMITVRREPELWSPLEYGCHVRDVLLVQRERVLLARRASGSACTPMGRDERADHDGYAEQQPDAVARQLRDAAALFAHALQRLGPGDWQRTLLYNYPEPAQRSLRWLAVHTEHELRHHLLDITRQLPAG